MGLRKRTQKILWNYFNDRGILQDCFRLSPPTLQKTSFSNGLQIIVRYSVNKNTERKVSKISLPKQLRNVPKKPSQHATERHCKCLYIFSLTLGECITGNVHGYRIFIRARQHTHRNKYTSLNMSWFTETRMRSNSTVIVFKTRNYRLIILKANAKLEVSIAYPTVYLLRKYVS